MMTSTLFGSFSKSLLLLGLAVAASGQTGKHRAIFTPTTPSATLVNSGQGGHNPNGTFIATAPFGSDVTAGHLLLAVCGYYSIDGLSGGSVSVTDTQGNIYAPIGTTGANSSLGHASQSWLFWTTAGSSGPDTATCTYGTAYQFVATVLEYNPSSSFILDTSNFTNVNAETSGCTNSLTTTATDFMFAYSFDEVGDSFITISPLSYSADYIEFSYRIYDFSRNAVAIGSQSTTITGVNSAPLHCGLVGFK